MKSSGFVYALSLVRTYVCMTVCMYVPRCVTDAASDHRQVRSVGVLDGRLLPSERG